MWASLLALRTDLRRIGLALYNVQDADIATCFALCRGHHTILGLQQSPHDIKYRRLSYRLCLLNVVTGEWCIRGHKEMTPRGRNQRGDNADEVVVHVPWIPKRCGTRRHDRRNQLVSLLK